MNAVSDIISSKAGDFFDPQDTPTAQSQASDPVVTQSNTDDTPSATSSEHKTQKSELDINQLTSMIHGMKDQLDAMLRVIGGEQVKIHAITSSGSSDMLATGEQVIEGVFNGEKMVGPDGQEYSVPPNYASKSKLVEGDMMKLTITNQGRFLFKQIGPIERKRIKGELISDAASGQWSVLAEGKSYKILTASVTFWKGSAGDEVILLVPDSGESSWGAVENIIHKT